MFLVIEEKKHFLLNQEKLHLTAVLDDMKLCTDISLFDGSSILLNKCECLRKKVIFIF